MTNEEIAKRISQATSAYANVTIEQWQYIDDMANGLEGQILCDIQDAIFEQYKNELIETLVAIAGLKPDKQPKEINTDIYAGMLRGIRIASFREIARHAKKVIGQAQAKNGISAKPSANPFI